MKAWDGKTGWPHRHTVQRFVCLVFQHDCVDLTHYCAGVTNHWLARFSRFQSTRYKTSNSVSELWPWDLYELLKLAVHETSFVPRVFVLLDQPSGNERTWKEWKSENLALEKSYSRPQRPRSFWSAPGITVVTWCLRTYIGLRPYMNESTIKPLYAQGGWGVTVNTTYLGELRPLTWPDFLSIRYVFSANQICSSVNRELPVLNCGSWCWPC